MQAWWLAGLMCMAAVAGCADGSGDDGPAPEAVEGPVSQDEGQTGSTVPLPAMQDAITQDWFFTSSYGLQNETPEAGAAALTGGFSTWATGTPFRAFTSAPVAEPTLVLPVAIDVDLYFTSSAPGAYNAALSYAVWAGSTQSMPLVQIGQTQGPVLPDEVQHLEVTLDWGTRLPVLVEPGGSIQLIVAINVDGAADAGALSLLVGGDDTASKATLTTQTMNIDPLAVASPVSETYTGTLVTSEPVECEVADDVSQAYHDVPVGENVSFLRAEASGTAGSGIGDLDIDLLDGTSVLGGGHTATTDEGVLWAGPDFEALRGKTLTLRVGMCLGAQMDYEVVVTQG